MTPTSCRRTICISRNQRTLSLIPSIAFALFLVVSISAVSQGSEKQTEVDYNRDIRPILSSNCFACHGFNEESREAELRLDEAESAHAERDGLPALVAGDPDDSELWRRIVTEDESERMPPVEGHHELSAEQKSLIRQWIEQGAKYDKHWAFVAPKKAALPKIAKSEWPKNEIDYFVLSKLESEKLAPAVAADRYTLIRRLSLDLTGLPPSAEQVEQFVADKKPGAYERLVDRFLASPHFGERMALDWLDASRYADTNGYSIDGGRNMWLWRDWVINAFNQNMPYDEFLKEQLAGDLFPNPTDAQLIATGFQRNNMNTHEGGTIPAENIVNYNADRVKTLGEAILGLTLGCAQCHDHKYDPISQKEYYQLFAYFNTISDVGLDGRFGKNSRPTFQAKTVMPTDEVPELKKQIHALQEKLAKPDAKEIEHWEKEQQERLAVRGKDMKLHRLELLKISTPNAGAGFEIDQGEAISISRAPNIAAYDISLRLPKLDRPITGIRVVFFPATENAADRGHGSLKYRTPEGKNKVARKTFVLTATSVSTGTTPSSQVNLSDMQKLSGITTSSFLEDFRPGRALDMRRFNGWSPDPEQVGPAHFTIMFAKPIDHSATHATIQLNFGFSGRNIAQRFEIFAMTGNDDGSLLPADIIAILEQPQDKRTGSDIDSLKTYFAKFAPQTERDRIELANLKDRLAALTKKHSAMVMDESKKPRATHILNRGDYQQPGEKVTASLPAALPSLEGVSPNRLGLARWLTMPNHPLTARVAVNRIWQIYFGRALVRTPADFGSQGQWPTHRNLLDFLAVDFIENNWDTKSLVRKIVTSATYRQSSATSKELVARDPANRLLASGPRFRLSAEFIRDAALKTSGLLNPWVGGPSVNPYLPGDLWREVSHYGSSNETAQTFVQDHGSKLYRRSLYTYWKRTVPPPNMAAFDAPNRETCVVLRPSTTTPLQALVLLNDVQYLEAARAFAERIIASSSDDNARLRWALLESFSRLATDAELETLTAALERERTRYKKSPGEAKKFLSHGESLRKESIPEVEHAAWAQISLLIFNLSEQITRN